MIITEFDSTQEFADEVGELRAISGHMLGAAGVQIPEDNLDDLHSSREEDGTLEDFGSTGLMVRIVFYYLEQMISKGNAFPTIVKIRPVGCDPLALVDYFTHVEDNIATNGSPELLILGQVLLILESIPEFSFSILQGRF
ncbi:hypothetical protein Tco_0038844 [Tanacetum coccineum]